MELTNKQYLKYYITAKDAHERIEELKNQSINKSKHELYFNIMQVNRSNSELHD